jgi:hypothetical protein
LPASVHAAPISWPQSVFSWKIATVFGRSAAGISARSPFVCLPTSGDFQNGEKRYLKPCWWTLLSANAIPRYGVLFFSATEAAGRVEIRAEAAEVGDHALGGE